MELRTLVRAADRMGRHIGKPKDSCGWCCYLAAQAEISKYREALDIIATCPPDAVHLMPLAAQAALATSDGVKESNT